MNDLNFINSHNIFFSLMYKKNKCIKDYKTKKIRFLSLRDKKNYIIISLEC